MIISNYKNTMINVLFVCHGNICRSPMAEFVFKDIVKNNNCSQHFNIASAATSTEALGNAVHYGTKEKLNSLGISVAGKTAVQMKKSDYEKYDYIFCMDTQNIKNTLKITGEDKMGKISRLLDITKTPDDIADPWYTGNFDKAYDDILYGCETFFSLIKSKI